MKDYFRPLKITHEWFGYSVEDSFEHKVSCIENRVKQIKNEGYGGIVTNVHCVNYLKDPDEWKLMREKVRICKENDMRMWLYDENGYPSGAAGTETISANIDYEARAVVMVSKLLAPKETWISELPRGHEKPISAFAYCISGDKITDEELLAEALRPAWENSGFTFINESDNKNLLCLAFYQKHMYEGGHCEHNCCAARRYFDISNKDAVNEFINNTYKRYAETVGEYFSPQIGDTGENSVIEAIFTDEPSYMGFYLNGELIAPHTVHPIDKELVLYPVIMWGRDFTNRFSSVHGYQIEDNMPYLYLGNSEKAQAVRKDFYQIVTELLEQSFFAQISDYCASAGLKFSGHILLEESIRDHVGFEGNFFKLLRHMHYPGLDFLNSRPEKVWQFAFTPLLVSSIASLYGRPHVMDEVSAHAQGGKATIEQIYISLMLQYAFGADVFNSYYGEDYPLDEYKRLWESISYIQSVTTDKEDRSAVLIHYPFESITLFRKPDQPLIEEVDHSRPMMALCEGSMISAMYAMLDTQRPFNFCDTETLEIALKRKPKVFVIGAGILDDTLVAKARTVSEKGTEIIYLCETAANANVFENSAYYMAQYEKEFNKIKDFAHLASTKEELIKLVDKFCGGPRTSGDTEKVAALWTKDSVLLVNSEATEKQITLNQFAPSEATNAFTRQPVGITVRPDGKPTVTLPAYAAILVK